MALRKLPRHYAGFVMPFILSLMMSCLVTGISVLRTEGLSPHFLHLWMSAWGLSWVVAFPVLLVVLPFVRRVVRLLVEE